MTPKFTTPDRFSSYGDPMNVIRFAFKEELGSCSRLLQALTPAVVTADVKAQYAPEPLITAIGVISSIFKSSQSDQVVAYLRSNRTISSNFTWLRPITCHSPVIPGFASRIRLRCHV